MTAVLAPISIAELVDKITILEIKAERLADPDKVENVKAELDALVAKAGEIEHLFEPRMSPHWNELRFVNKRIWEAEETIRACDAAADFGQAFIEAARAIHRNNDRRAQAKRLINVVFDSAIVEEKSY